MQRLARFNIGDRYVSDTRRQLAEIAFGLLCGGAMMGIRALVNLWAPESGPFAMIYPAVLIATLFSSWRGGISCFVLTFGWAWYFVLRPQGDFAFEDPTDPARVAINAVCVLVVVLFAEAFRRAVRNNAELAEDQLARKQVLMAELEHRTKNNFALVAALLEIQKKREKDPRLDVAFDDAIRRVRTFAEAYSNLQLEQEEGAETAMKPYLENLAGRVASAALHDGVDLDCDIADVTLPREIAVAIGLYVNEAIANCGKYAFADGRDGSVEVSLIHDGKAWTATVVDDGAGTSARPNEGGGLGARLLNAFAHQARASHLSHIDENGATMVLTALPRED
ncbi:MAG: histidine kinase [Sphingomonadales bacterium CG12_big_fil_rev_8_21_14_0_65_65_10]|uniref:sensor histidine kinase n=1 Tax=Blastomonas marina TaxID=1867408 RepID=UPI000CB5A074|nr:histidine kinase dimerization/phosphoacceptor domain -containing protein [Blastomonas marina]PIW56005.1 MAG: histidine kinase [Sphingomonadales bacterium CG12_big_fil_rev_8_21_14_0_65_65_10]WPZ02692.1 histidine kinase dimerization/phosphoacceptor domain -containing protein [Blastomonas marina]